MKVHKTSIDSPIGQQTIMHQRWRAFAEAVVKLPEPVIGKVHGREHGLPCSGALAIGTASAALRHTLSLKTVRKHVF